MAIYFKSFELRCDAHFDGATFGCQRNFPKPLPFIFATICSTFIPISASGSYGRLGDLSNILETRIR
jgi:hypothetical protein